MGQDTQGTAFFRINGVQYAIGGEMRINPLNEKRNPLVGLDGIVMPQIEFQSPMVECAVKDVASVDLIALTRMENVTVTVEMANGTVWELSNAFYAGDGELDAKEGDFQVRFHGSKIRRLV